MFLLRRPLPRSLRLSNHSLTHLTKPPTAIPSHRLNSISTFSQNPNQVIVSGIQPTGVPHIGNYLGALQQWVSLQNDSPPGTKLLYSIVDWHAITKAQDPKLLSRRSRETLATLLAIGIDPERSVVFVQSSVCGFFFWENWSSELADEVMGDRYRNIWSFTGTYFARLLPGVDFRG